MKLKLQAHPFEKLIYTGCTYKNVAWDISNHFMYQSWKNVSLAQGHMRGLHQHFRTTFPRFHETCLGPQPQESRKLRTVPCSVWPDFFKLAGWISNFRGTVKQLMETQAVHILPPMMAKKGNLVLAQNKDGLLFQRQGYSRLLCLLENHF